MNDNLKYKYESVLALYIEGLVLEKKSLGYIYDTEAYILKRFDDFCIERGHPEACVTCELAAQWATQRDAEGINYRN